MDWKHIYKIKRFKYWVATAVFVVVILFIDPNNLLVTHRLHRQVSELHDEERQLRVDIHQDSINAAAIEQNLDAIEHYGRENYYMKRTNEDIFVVR
ncbi:MAG: septum formation initiator family protein [Bacteroidales bacterium]|nr:septum formation initiator family protein [Bacteroidales bacterium]